MAHVEQLPSGSWRVTVKAGGLRARGTAASLREANALGARLLLQLEQTAPKHRRRRVGSTVGVAAVDALREDGVDEAAARSSPPTFGDY